MQIDHLRYFVALSDYNSITKTSHVFDTTPQNVSRILKKLEDEMNAILFIRTQEGIQLTPEGVRFLHFAKNTIYQFDELYAAFQFNSAENKEVTLYSSEGINNVVLRDILLAFAQDYPAITVKNITVDWKNGYTKLQQDPTALGFHYFLPDENNKDDNLLVVPTLELHPVAVVNKTHPLAQAKSFSKQQLINEKLLIYVKNELIDTTLFHALGLDQDPKGKSIACSGNMQTCYQMVANNGFVYITMIETFMQLDESLRKNLVTVPITDNPFISCALIKSRSLPLDSPQQLLYSYILNAL